MDKFVPKEPGLYWYRENHPNALWRGVNLEDCYDDGALWAVFDGLMFSVMSYLERGTFHPGPIPPPEEGRG